MLLAGVPHSECGDQTRLAGFEAQLVSRLVLHRNNVSHVCLMTSVIAVNTSSLHIQHLHLN